MISIALVNIPGPVEHGTSKTMELTCAEPMRSGMQKKDLLPAISTTKKPELDSGLSATFYIENNFKLPLDAAPQICACQPHTV
jgi:hypothetical protein